MLELSPEEIDFVFTLAGRHPLLLQIACYHLFEAKQKNEVNRVSPVSIKAKFNEEAAPYLGYI